MEVRRGDVGRGFFAAAFNKRLCNVVKTVAGCAALEFFDVAEALRDGDRADGFFAFVFSSVAPMSILFS